MKLDRNFWITCSGVIVSASLLGFILISPPTPKPPVRLVIAPAAEMAMPSAQPRPEGMARPPEAAPPTIVASAEPEKPRFILLLDGGQPIVYEVLRTVEGSFEGGYRYINGDGIKRSWKGNFLISNQPIKFTGTPVVFSPSGEQFKAN